MIARRTGRPGSKFIKAGSSGRRRILTSIMTMRETGEALMPLVATND